jgi:hypothetical protein
MTKKHETKKDYVFHASPVQNLHEISPHESEAYIRLHMQFPAVFACKTSDIAAVFLGHLGGDSTCEIRLEHSIPVLYEKFAGAFHLRYGADNGIKRQGSIYVLPRETFVKRAVWVGGLASEQPVVPLFEMKIPDVESYLRMLNADNRISIKLHDGSNAASRHYAEEQLRSDSPGATELRKYHPSIIEFLEKKKKHH